jgi:hypothetical protein
MTDTKIEIISLRKKIFKIQGEIGMIPKDGKSFVAPFTTLPALLAKVLPLFREHGILLTVEDEPLHNGTASDGVVVTHTMRIIAEDIETGETKVTSVPIILDNKETISKKGEVQYPNVLHSYGKSSTYGFRYGLMKMLGMCPEVDTDGFPTALISEDRSSLKSKITMAMKFLKDHDRTEKGAIKIQIAIDNNFKDSDDEALVNMNKWLEERPVVEKKPSGIDRSAITFQLWELWNNTGKQGTIRAQEDIDSQKAIRAFKDDFVGYPDEYLVKLRDWIAGL